MKVNSTYYAQSKQTLAIVLFCFGLISHTLLAQAPNISYSGVATNYPLNVAITALTPTNTGGAVSAANTLTTFAGRSNSLGSADGTGTSAIFSSIWGIDIDASGNLYIAEVGGHAIRKITTPAGVVSTFAGKKLTSGYTNATVATSARFEAPYDVAVDASGNVYVAEKYVIRKISSAGVVTTLAGGRLAGYRFKGSADGTGISALFDNVIGHIAVDTSGNVYVVDRNNHKIRKITPAGVVTTLAGSSSNTSGSTDGTGTSASFNYPSGITIDASGNLYVTDHYNYKIRKITPAGVVSTFAGSGTQGSTDGTGTSASFNFPSGITIDASGNLYVTELRGIRKITPAGVVTTLYNFGRDEYPRDIAVDATNNLYISTGYQVILKIAQSSYSISPALPAGLSIDASGVISGTPTAAAPTTTYTITGSNSSGSSSTTITFSVSSCTAPSITTAAAASTNPICSNATLDLSVGASGTAPLTYAWAGTGTFTNGTTATPSVTGAATGNYVVTVSNACGNVESTVAVTVNPSVTPSVSISANPGQAITAGVSVTFTATASHGGTPSYQWKKNGTNVGSNQNTYTDGSLANNDVIKCEMTSTAACASPSMATSNEITMQVCNCSPTCSPIPTAAGTYTGAISYTDGSGITHYCDASGNLLLSTKPVAVGSNTTINPSHVRIKIDATAATFYPKWCGALSIKDNPCFMILEPSVGNALINRRWHIDAVQGTAIGLTNRLQVAFYFKDTEYTALNTALTTNGGTALTNSNTLNLYVPFASPELGAFPEINLIKYNKVSRFSHGTTPSTAIWKQTTLTNGIIQANFIISTIKNSGGIGKFSN